MMKERIRAEARLMGLKKVGFAEKSVVALFPYFVQGETGNVSMYARGLDYHTVVEKKLEKLAELLKVLGAKETFVHVDKGNLDDRKAAFEAGLGFFGKNGMLICNEFGSYFFIGQVVHDLDIERDLPYEGGCLDCGACKSACPGGALTEDGFVIKKCLSEITQKRGELTAEEKRLIKENGMCWGCDECQRVCPHNKGLGTTAMHEFLEARRRKLDVSEIENLSNREFREQFGKYAFSWRGKTVILRNLKLLAENTEKQDGEK